MKTKSKNLLLYMISILLIVTIVSATVTAFASDEKSKPIETITEPQKNDGEQVEEVQGEVKESEKVEQSQVDAQALEADKEEDKKTDVSSNSKIANASPRTVGSQFTVDSPSGAKIRYTVLAEDATQQTGTVSIGWPGKTGPGGSSTKGNGLGSNLTNTDLVLSDTVNYNGYTYTVTELGDSSLSNIGITSITLPSTLKKIGNQALNGNSSCKILKIPEGVTYIGTGQFRGCTSLEVLYLPSTINTLGTELFGDNTKLRTIFLPVSNTITVDKSEGNNVPFYGLPNDVVIVCKNQELYNKWVKDTTIFRLPSSVLTYEMTMEFYNQNGTKLIVDKEVKRLYNMPLSWEKQADGSYLNKFISLSNLGTLTDLPVLPNEASLGYKANYWGLNELGITTVDATGKIEISNTQTGDNQASLGITHVTSNKMFAFPDKFEILINTVDKVYDGYYDLKTSFNRTNVENLLERGSPVELLFFLVEKDYATPSEYTSHYAAWSFRKNSLVPGVRNVVDSGDYVVMFTYMDTRVSDRMYQWQTPYFYTAKAVPLAINITPADIDFTLNIDDILWADQTALPDITLSYDNDGIDGTIVWDQGQAPQKGTHSYSYTFVPSNASAEKLTDRTATPAMVNNFTSTSKQGSIDITYKEILKYTVTFKDTNGKVLKEEIVEENKSATAPTTPTLEGYDFIGWDKDFVNITDDTTVTAQYKIQSFLVLYLDYNGNVLKKEMVDYGQTIQAPSAPTREGYTFKNWDEATDKVTKNLVVMPIYEINKYEIQFIDYDGVILKQELVNYGGMILPPNNPTREGYKFTGWDKSFSHITASMKIKAEYEKIEISKPTISEPKENIEIPAYKKLKPEVLGQNNKRLTQNNEGPNQNIEVDLRQEPTTNEKTNIVEDKAVGTKIETVNKDMVFDPNLKVSVVAANKEESLKATQELDNVVKVFDVILEQDGIRVEKTLDSKIRIYIDAKEFEKYKDMKMYQQTSNGQYVELPMKVENGQIIFECDALDTYVLTGIESQDEFPWWIIVVGAVTIVGIIIIVKKRKSEDKDI